MFYLILKRTPNPLARKLARAYNLSAIALHDLWCSLHWYLGGCYFYRRHFDRLRRQHRWIFIVGCNNSGTTLLQKILEGTGAVSTHRYEGQMYTRVLARTRRRGHMRVWSDYLPDLIIAPDHEMTQAPRLLHDWMRALPRPVRPIIVEKTPANLMRMGWLARIFPNSSFIGMARNGYAVAEGIRRKGEQEIGKAASHWNQVNTIMREQQATVPNFHLLRYEDLCDHPHKTLTELAPILGIDAEVLITAAGKAFSLLTVEGSGASYLTNYNPASFARLTKEDKKRIHDNAAPMLAWLGYE